MFACCLGQLPVVVQAPFAWISNDSPQYIQLAQRMLTLHQFIDAYRTPAYPALLALVFLLSGGEHLTVVAVVQSLLMILASVELYVLTYRMYAQRWTAVAVAAIAGLNVFATTWERVIMTEALSYWLMITLFLVLERYVRRGRTVALAWYSTLSVVAILTRPIFLLLPGMLLLCVALWAWRQHAFRQRWKQLSLSLVLIYAVVLGYVGANGLINGYFGISDASNIDIFARVLRYDMYALPLRGPAAQQYAQVQARITSHVEHGGVLAREPWGFVQQYPEYAANHYKTLSDFSIAEIEQHPWYLVVHTLPDIRDGFYAGPYLYAPDSYAPLWVTTVEVIFSFLARAYVFFPLLLLAALIHAWRRPEHVGYVMSVALLLSYAELTLMGTTLSYEGFWRLRFPMEWGVLLVSVVLLVGLVQTLARILASGRQRLRMILGAHGAYE